MMLVKLWAQSPNYLNMGTHVKVLIPWDSNPFSNHSNPIVNFCADACNFKVLKSFVMGTVLESFVKRIVFEYFVMKTVFESFVMLTGFGSFVMPTGFES